jgi:inhibitor of KinA sporulation pathway (predicted exonuclease)
MRVLLDAILVVDVEATCWKDASAPEGQTSEIIQIGLCELMVKTQTIDRSINLIIKPTRSVVSEFCTELTGLTQDIVDQGITYLDAYEIMVCDFKSKKRTWASFGDYDHYMFEKMSKLCTMQFPLGGIKYPFGPRHINVKNLVALWRQFGKEYGMLGTLTKLGLKHVGKHHDGLDDAKNIASILAYILWGKSSPPEVQKCTA